MLRCYTHGLDYAGYTCPRCANEKQHRESLEANAREQERNREANAREQERNREANARGLREVEERNREVEERNREERSLIVQQVENWVQHQENTNRELNRGIKKNEVDLAQLAQETAITEEVALMMGLDPGYNERFIKKYELLADGKLSFEYLNPFLSLRLKPHFEEGIGQYKAQFQGPGVGYIQAQIEACAAFGFVKNKELGEQPKWEFDNNLLTIFFYQIDRVFTLKIHIRNQNNLGHIPFLPPLKPKNLDLATFEVEDEDQPLYTVSPLDGTVTLNEGVVAQILKEQAADFEDPIRLGLDHYVHSLNEATRKQERFLSVKSLQEVLQRVWDKEQRRIEENKPKIVEIEDQIASLKSQRDDLAIKIKNLGVRGWFDVSEGIFTFSSIPWGLWLVAWHDDLAGGGKFLSRIFFSFPSDISNFVGQIFLIWVFGLGPVLLVSLLAESQNDKTLKQNKEMLEKTNKEISKLQGELEQLR